MKEELLRQETIHCDETPVQVLKEDGRKAESKSYMWVYTSGKYEQRQIVIYDYSPTRNGDVPEKFLNGFDRYLHTDGYAGYNKLKHITRCCCWAHLRRYFLDAAEVTPQYALQEKTAAQIGVDYCDKLFDIESKLSDESARNC